jgi:hypothetical protein
MYIHMYIHIYIHITTNSIKISMRIIHKIKGDTYNVYKRGIGNINIVCNMHEISEKETVCRYIYIYIYIYTHICSQARLVYN